MTRPKLIIINGAPGVGKTTIGRLVFAKLPNSAFLDGDSVWQINPFEVNDRTIAVVEKNIPFVLRSYLEAGYQYVILVWVLHRQEIIDRLLDGLSDLDFELRIFTLVADEQVLVDRISRRDPERKNLDLVRDRLRQSLALDTPKVDVTRQTPEEAAAAILHEICHERLE